jgi:hypothetical protein
MLISNKDGFRKKACPDRQKAYVHLQMITFHVVESVVENAFTNYEMTEW